MKVPILSVYLFYPLHMHKHVACINVTGFKQSILSLLLKENLLSLNFKAITYKVAQKLLYSDTI